MSKIKHLQFFTAVDDKGETFGGVFILHENRYYILSDYAEFDSHNLPREIMHGFSFAQYMCLERNLEDFKDVEYIQDQVNGWDDLKLCGKREALRAAITYRRNFPVMFGYRSRFAKGNFEFGCGAVSTSPESVQILLKVLSKLTPSEYAIFINLLAEIKNEDSDAFYSLKENEETIKKLLKMPEYLETLKK